MTSTTDTTSVQVDFYTPGSTTSSTIVNATLIDNRNNLTVNLQCEDPSTFVSAQVLIDTLPASSPSSLKSFSLRLGQNYIGTSSTVSSNDIKYDFVDDSRYCIKIKVLIKKNGSISTLYSKYSYGPDDDTQDLTAYNYLFRLDGGDVFNGGDDVNDVPAARVTNPNDIQNGSDINIDCPLVLSLATQSGTPVEPGDDNRIPSKMLFTFDEIDDYKSPNGSDNSEQLSSYSVLQDYEILGEYTLENNQLTNDSIYLVNVTGIYSDGHTVSKTLTDKIHVLPSPVIQNVIAYGLDSLLAGVDKLGSGDPQISSIMNVFLTAASSPVKIETYNDKITFELRQGTTTYYSVTVPVNTTIVNGLIEYKIEKDSDFITETTSYAPLQEANGTYKFDVFAVTEYKSVDGSDNIIKTSLPFPATFSSDINQLPSFSILNAWIGASVTKTGSVREVNLDDTTSADGYEAAPAFGIVGNFSKTDYYGSGVPYGLFADLDKVDANGVPTTNHKFTATVNTGSESVTVPVTQLYQLQGDPDATNQENYVELMKRREGVYELNGVETVLTSSQLTQFKGQSNNIITYSASGNEEDGWLVVNTGPNTNGATGGALPKVNFYFYSYVPTPTPTSPPTSTTTFTMAQSTGIGMYAFFYQNAGALEYPFFNVYTARTGAGDKGSFYRSRIFFGPSSAGGNTVSDNGRVGITLAFTGVDDGTLFPEIPASRRVQYARNNAFSDLSSTNDSVTDAELVLYLTMQTSSNATTSSAGSFNFRVFETGMFTSNASFKRISFRYNQPKPRRLYSENGVFSNIPGSPGEAGSDQPNIYFWIPSSASLFNQINQENSVAVSIQIIGPNSEMTLPDPTPSNEQVIIHKVNSYVMTVGTASEPTFTGTGASAVLTVPINNPTSDSGDFYLESATFTSNLNTPNDSVTKPQSSNGVFDITITNPSARGADENVEYQVFYTIADPNGLDINGPESEKYNITLKDRPTSNTITINPFTYKTYNYYAESSFKFDVLFDDVGDTGVDGMNVYFTSANIPKTLVEKVSRYVNGVETNPQNNITVLLQSTTDATKLVGGINILDIDRNPSTNKWSNFSGATISFVPYSTTRTNSDTGVEVESTDAVEIDINHIPVIESVKGVELIGGVIQSFDFTQMVWTNDLSSVYGSYNSVDASYDLELNTQDVTNSINESNSSYNVNMGGAVSTYTLIIKVKITADNDDSVYYSEPVTLEFDSVSVDQSGVDIEFLRGSNNMVIRTTYTNFSVDDSTESLVVEEVELVDTSESESSDPADSAKLTLTSTIADGVLVTYGASQPAPAIQPSSGTTTNINNYDISGYSLGDVLELNYRVKAGVQYTVTGTTGTVDSTALYLTLPTATPYTVAGRPQISINPTYQVGTGTYAGRIGINITMNSNGLFNEGIQSLLFFVAQVSDYTVATDGDGEGIRVVVSYSSSQTPSSSYDVEDPATTTTTGDNIAPGETVALYVDDVLYGSTGASDNWTLVAGNETSNDNTVLYAPSNSGFNDKTKLGIFGVISTRLGSNFTFEEVTKAS